MLTKLAWCVTVLIEMDRSPLVMADKVQASEGGKMCAYSIYSCKITSIQTEYYLLINKNTN